MKLIFLSNLRLPSEKAASFQSMTMCSEFSKLTPTTLVVPSRKNTTPLANSDPFSFYDINPSFTIKKIACLDLKSLQKISERLWFQVLNLSFLILAWFYLLSQADQDTVVYTRDQQLLPVLKSIRCLKHIAFFWECHAIPKAEEFKKLQKQKLSGIVALTQAAKNFFLAHGFSDEEILVSHDAVHLKEYVQITKSQQELRRLLNLPADKTILTYVGRFKTLGKEKGIVELIQSVKHLKNSESLHFLFVGGPLEVVEDYLKLIKDLGLNEKYFEFRDRVPQKEVSLYLKASDILLMPFPREPHYEINMSPLKMFEYMASGVPIITSDLATIREVLSPDEAFFCQPNDSLSLANQISNLVDDQEKQRKLAANALQKVKDYTWDKRAQKIIKFINHHAKFEK